MIAFTGSQNETAGGFVSNFDSIDVYWFWDDPHGRTKAKAVDFHDLWAGAPDNPALVVDDFTQIANEILAKYRRDEPPEFDPDEEVIRRARRGPRTSQIPATIQLQDHQVLGFATG